VEILFPGAGDGLEEGTGEQPIPPTNSNPTTAIPIFRGTTRTYRSQVFCEDKNLQRRGRLYQELEPYVVNKIGFRAKRENTEKYL
jgi:hypothetical protein